MAAKTKIRGFRSGTIYHTQAFDIQTKHNIINDVIKICPIELNSYLSNNIKAINSSLEFLNRNPNVNFDSNKINDTYSLLVGELKTVEKNNFNTANKFGILAGAIMETINPYNMRSKGGVRVRFPQAVLQSEIITYDGYNRISDVKLKTAQTIKNYELYYSFYPPEKIIIDKAYESALNEIADLWVTAWESSGNNISGLYASKEIDHRKPIAEQEKSESAQYGSSHELNYKMEGMGREKNSSERSNYWNAYHGAIDAIENDDYHQHGYEMEKMENETGLTNRSEYWDAYHGAIDAIEKGDYHQYGYEMEKMENAIDSE